jgi:hypothetical protein
MYHIQEKLPRLRLIYGLTLCVLVLIFAQPQVAMAQWTTPDSSGNITNTNTGKVGIGAVSFDSWDSTIFKVLGLNTNYGFTIAAGNSSGNALHITDRAYFDGSYWKYSASSTPISNYFMGSGIHVFRVAPAGTAGNNVTWTEAMRITNSGNIGIGTNTPSHRLHIAGDNVNSYPILKLQNTQTNGHSWWLYSGAFGTPGAFGIYDETTGAYRMFFDAGGNVGIGTTNTSYKLEVSSATATDDGVLRVTGTGVLGAGLHLNATDTGGRIWRLLSTGSSSNSGAGKFGIYDTTAGAYRMLIDTSGNVGIGTTNPSPTAKLDVNGNTKVTGDINATGNITGGTINATYQDVAEWVPATHALPAGTVVVLNPTKSNEVMASISAYDTRVAGVVSERPGLALGEAGRGKALVATTGRVKVMVDAIRAPIHIGDLLVTSDEEGVAMKSEPLNLGGAQIHRPGTLIGKALESLESGKAQILVLLSLQ